MIKEVELKRINVSNPKNSINYYQFPKILFEDSLLSKISTEAKVLYVVLLDLSNLSKENNWVNKNGDVYVRYPIERIQALFNCGHNKAIKTLAELDSKTGVGLIDKELQGMGMASKIYVKNILIDNSKGLKEFKKGSQEFEKRSQELPKKESIKTNSINLNLNELNYNNTNEKDNGNEKMFPSEFPREKEKSFSLDNSIDIKDKEILETKRLLEDTKDYSNNKDYSKYYKIKDIEIIDKLKDIIDIDKYILENNNKYYIKDYSKMFLELYKIYCKDLPSVRTFSNERQKMFKKFTKEYTPSEILQGLELISQSDFLRGKLPNSTWSANIEWLMKLGNFEKILSGTYNRTSSNGTTGGLKDTNIKKAGDKIRYEF